jgi:hypothetical protein
MGNFKYFIVQLINFSSYFRDNTTGEVVELGSGEFRAPNLSSYTFVDSFNFI